MTLNEILMDIYKHCIQAMFPSYCCYFLNIKSITEKFINNISHSIVSSWVLTQNICGTNSLKSPEGIHFILGPPYLFKNVGLKFVPPSEMGAWYRDTYIHSFDIMV